MRHVKCNRGTHVAIGRGVNAGVSVGGRYDLCEGEEEKDDCAEAEVLHFEILKKIHFSKTRDKVRDLVAWRGGGGGVVNVVKNRSPNQHKKHHNLYIPPPHTQ